MGLVDRCRVWFFPTRPKELRIKVEEGEDGDVVVDDRLPHTVTEPPPSDEDVDITKTDRNRELIHQNAKRITRIDERTAFIARIVFALFVAFFVSLGAGIAVTWLNSPSSMLSFGLQTTGVLILAVLAFVRAV